MATIGVIKIAAEFATAGITKGAKTAAGALKKFEASTASVAGSVLSLKGALVGAAGAYGLTAVVRSSMEAVGSVGRLSETLGIATEDLTRLQFAANASGIDTATLDGSLAKLNQGLVEVAKTGSGPASMALRKLGLSAHELVKAGPTESFKQLTSSLQQIQNPAERAAASLALFGSEDIARMASLGSEGIAALESEADQLGVTLSSVDVAQVTEANGAMAKLSAAVGALGNVLAVELAPFITAATGQFISFAKASQESGGVIGAALSGIGTAAGFALDSFDALGHGFHLVQSYITDGIGYIVDGLAKLAGAFDYILEKISGTKSGISDFLTVYAEDLHRLSETQYETLQKSLVAPSTKEKLASGIADIKESAKTRAETHVATKPKAGADLMKPIEMKLSGAAQLGSKEAVQAAAKFRTGIGLDNDPMKKTAGNTGKIVELQTKTVSLLQKVVSAREPSVVTSLVGN